MDMDMDNSDNGTDVADITPVESVLVVLSGGQDSATCLFKAMSEPEIKVEGCVFFDYGQKHKESEFSCAKRLCDHLGIRLIAIPVAAIAQVSLSALVTDSAIAKDHLDSVGVVVDDVGAEHPLNLELPASFVPGRNLIFLTLAASAAYSYGIGQIWTGVCQTDYSGYPDCRQPTIVALNRALRLGLGLDPEGSDLEIVTPLMFHTKAETFQMAYELGCLKWIIHCTHTGYTGSRARLWPWGWGPAEEKDFDPATKIRARGWEDFIDNLRKTCTLEEVLDVQAIYVQRAPDSVDTDED